MKTLGKIDENDIFDGIKTEESAIGVNNLGPPELPRYELPEYTLPESDNFLGKGDAAAVSVRVKRPKGNNESVKLFEVYNELNSGNPYIPKFGARSVAEVKAGYKKNRTKKYKKHKKSSAKQIAKKRARASIKRATRGLKVAQSAVKRAQKTLKKAKQSYKKVS